MKAVTVAVMPTTIRTCVKCGILKELKEFRCCGGSKGNWGLYYSHTCRDCHNEYKRNWRKSRPSEYQKMREKNFALYGTSYSPKQCIYNNARLTKRRNELRVKAIALYGGECECCGENDSKKLTFDHIQGNGRGDVINTDYSKAIKCGYPNNKYRLLCWNCNTSYGFYKYCPHKHPSTVQLFNQVSLYNRRIKCEIIEAYGGQCVICGENHPEFMTIDHTNGGGCHQRRKNGGVSGTSLYLDLKRRGFPKNDYRLLCFNCNSSIGLRKGKVGLP